ncbi:hypothetical protein BVG16_05515 [Paenibacillus selenitireducens]|uniref:Glycosyl transferase family 1 domain-containing protein n=1 Tax=Paenibacillus selenitireducens TaxID=1324314 RepID=A0A1T2XK11_9BACL|nr:DUF4214 domain-containing protein [Paenibacillus selenitireducens]OPA80201.1 hypothetical protein BVG16_05515 [Paenibacillus selenitireducens]
MVNRDRIVQILYRLVRLEGVEFISELYRQLLNREPDLPGLQHHVSLLSRHTSKISIINSFLQSDEAESTYKQMQYNPLDYNRSTIARMISQFYLASHLHFVHALYNELLGRNPEQGGIDIHVQCLLQGVNRQKLLTHILLSEECQRLLHAEQAPIFLDMGVPQSGSHTSKRIGVFVAFAQPLDLDGEGIGRFLARLVHGLLLQDSKTTIYVVTTAENYAGFERLFGTEFIHFPGRLNLLKSNSMDWINQHVPADVWIVPSVSLELAMYLHKPFIFCLHDLVYLHFPELYYGKIPDFTNRVNRFAYPLADKAAAVVFNSHYVRTADGIGFLGLPAEKTHVIRLAAPVEEYASFGIDDEVTFRHKYNLFGHYIVFPSIIRLHKNHCRLIEAFIKFRQTADGHISKLQLVLTDNYQTSLLNKEITDVLNRCHDLEIRNSIHFMGRMPSADLPSFYRYATGTIVPTLFEGSCPFPILESLAVDTPVAASRIEVTKEVLHDLDAFIPFDPHSVDEMAFSIQLLFIHNRNLLARQKSTLSPAHYRSWSDVAQEYYNLMQQVAR